MTHHAEVRAVLADLIHDPDECQQKDGSYCIAWPTAYDDEGEPVGDDPVAGLLPRLPPGWTAEWTGGANGDTEDFVVFPTTVTERYADELPEADFYGYGED